MYYSTHSKERVIFEQIARVVDEVKRNSVLVAGPKDNSVFTWARDHSAFWFWSLFLRGCNGVIRFVNKEINQEFTKP